MGQNVGGDSLDQTQSIIVSQRWRLCYRWLVTVNMSGDKTENKKRGEDFGLLNSNCALKISRQPAIPNLWVIPYNFLQVELIIRGLDQLVLSPMNKTHLF
jgi:hypothetical protein